MKKILALILAVSMPLSFAACKDKDDENDNDGKKTNTEEKVDKTGKAELDRAAKLEADEYLEYILLEKDSTASEISKVIAEYKDTMKQFSGNISVSAKAEDGFVDFLEEIDSDAAEFYSENLGWLKNAKIDMAVDMEDRTLLGADSVIYINDAKIAGVNMIVDAENGERYFTIPELSDTALYTELGDASLSDYVAGVAKQNTILDAIPSEQALTKLITKYANHVLDNIEEANKEAEEISVDDVTMQGSKVSFEIDSDSFRNIAIAVTEEFLDDDEIRDFLTAYFELEYFYSEYYDSAEDMADELYDNIENMFEEIKDDKDYFDSLKDIDVELYTDNENNIVGLVIEYDRYEIISYLYAENNGKFAFELNSNEKNIMYGNGSIEKNKLSGDIVIMQEDWIYDEEEDEYEDFSYEAVNLKLENIDIEKLEKNLLCGTVTIAPGSEFSEYAYDTDIIEDCELKLIFEQDKASEVTLTGELYYNGDKAITAGISTSEKEAKKITVPKNALDANDEENIEEYLSNAKLSTLIKNLRNANVSTDIIKLFQNFFV